MEVTFQNSVSIIITTPSQANCFFFLHRSSLLETNKFAKERSVENELEENNDENCDDAHDPINLADVKDETDGMNDENN